jgi:hypothetical protein
MYATWPLGDGYSPIHTYLVVPEIPVIIRQNIRALGMYCPCKALAVAIDGIGARVRLWIYLQEAIKADTA